MGSFTRKRAAHEIKLMNEDSPTKPRPAAKREVVLPPGWRRPSRLARKIAVIATVGVVLGGLVGYWNAYKTLSTAVLAPTGPVTAGAPAFGEKGESLAPVVQRDFVASPDVYAVTKENDQYRIVQGTWKPRQRDQFHSHPNMLWVWVTDCSFRIHFPGGTSQDRLVKAGESGFQEAVASHSLENLGNSDCTIVMFESK